MQLSDCLHRRVTLDDSENQCIQKLQKGIIKWILSKKKYSKKVVTAQYNYHVRLLSRIIVEKKVSELKKKRIIGDMKLYRDYLKVLQKKRHNAKQSIRKAKFLLCREKKTHEYYENASKRYTELVNEIHMYPTVRELRVQVQRLHQYIQVPETDVNEAH